MLNTGFQYINFKTNIGFLKFKQHLINNKFWLFFFYTHAFSITICLFVGLSQFSKSFLTNHPRDHRIIGKIYFYNVLFQRYKKG